MNTQTEKNINCPHSALRQVVRIVGGQCALAEKCNVKQQSVFMWIKKGRLPAERVLQVEKIVGGLVSRHDLRPDIYPRE